MKEAFGIKRRTPRFKPTRPPRRRRRRRQRRVQRGDGRPEARRGEGAEETEEEGEIQKRMATFIPSAPAQGFLENGPESSAPA